MYETITDVNGTTWVDEFGNDVLHVSIDEYDDSADVNIWRVGCMTNVYSVEFGNPYGIPEFGLSTPVYVDGMRIGDFKGGIYEPEGLLNLIDLIESKYPY